MKAVAFNGSVRPGGNTELMLKRVLAGLEAEGIQTELVQVGGNPIRGCRACGVCKKMQNQKCVYAQDLVNDAIAKMVQADAIIFGSPSYFMNMSSEMKALIDRSGMVTRANGGLLKHKVGAAVCSQRRAGAASVISSMNYMMLMSEMFLPGANYLNIGFGMDKGDVENDEEGMKTMDNLAKNIAFLLKKLHA